MVHNGTYVNGFHETWPIVYGEEAYGFAKLGQTIVDVPDAKIIRLYVDDEPFFLPTATLEGFERALDMRGRHAGPGAGLGPFVGAARVDPVAASGVAGASAPGGNRVRGHAAGERRAGRHRVGSGRRRPYDASQRRPPYPAARLRGARRAGEPHRGRPRGAWLRDQVERDDAVVRHRSRGADRLLVQREDVGRRLGPAGSSTPSTARSEPVSGSSSTSPTTRRGARRWRSSASGPSGFSTGPWGADSRTCW